MAEKLPIAFLAGLVSVVTPCVLPLVPGYLSAVSAVEVDAARRARRQPADRGREHPVHPRLHGRLRRCSAPGRPRSASVGRKPTQAQIAGFVLIVIGLAFIGLLPWPERHGRAGPAAARAADAGRARCSAARSRSARRRASARCSRRSSSSQLDRARSRAAIVLLVAYSLGLGAAFVARRRRVRACDARVPLGARPLRRACQVASGATLVALGLLLFFHRDWWLRDGAQPGALAGRARNALAPRAARRRRARGAAARTPRAGAAPSAAGARRRPACRARAGTAETTTCTSPWKKSRSSAAHARHASSNASCASKNSPAPREREARAW